MRAFSELTQKMLPASDCCSPGINLVTRQVLIIRLAAKQESTLMLLLQNEMNIQHTIGNIK